MYTPARTTVSVGQCCLCECLMCLSPDDHVTVGTHWRTCPSREMFCHLDQGVLIFRMGLRSRSGWDRTFRYTCTAVTSHTEGWSDQTSLQAVTWKRQKKETKKGIYCVWMCVSVFSSGLLDLCPSWLYTQQVSWWCMQLADYCCHSHGFTTSIFSSTQNISTLNTFLWCMCMHAYTWPNTHRPPRCSFC